jgi:protein-S-isoprenylcysteine O-methyltransferase Ste14
MILGTFRKGLLVLLLSLTLWLVWWFCWLLVGRSAKHNVRRESLKDRLRHLRPLALGAAMIFSTIAATPCVILWNAVWLKIAGLAVTCLGLAVACWARYHLGRNWSGLVVIKHGHDIVSSGPYNYVRHPIYSGLVLAMAGSTITAGTLFAVIGWLFVVLAFSIKLSHEEQMLTRVFGWQYAELCLSVPSRLFPGDSYLFSLGRSASALRLSRRTRL